MVLRRPQHPEHYNHKTSDLFEVLQMQKNKQDIKKIQDTIHDLMNANDPETNKDAIRELRKEIKKKEDFNKKHSS